MDNNKNNFINIEVIYLGINTHFFKSYLINKKATIKEVLNFEEIKEFLQKENIKDIENRIGIFGKKVTLDTLLKEGDRIEIYRDLMQDPKEARRKRQSS